MITATNIQNLSSAIQHFLLHSVLLVASMFVLAIFSVILVLTTLELIQVLILRFLSYRTAKNGSDIALLGLTFPSNTIKSAFATVELYRLLHPRAAKLTMSDRLLRRRRLYALEIFGTRGGGIRYVMAAPRAEIDGLSSHLLSFLPGLKIEEIGDYLPETIEPGKHYDIAQMKLSADFILPLQDHKLITEHDTAAFITGQMTKLAQGELVGFQLLVAPVSAAAHPHVTRRLKQVKQLIRAGKPLTPSLKSPYVSLPLHFLPLLLGLVFRPLIWALKGAGTILVELPAYITDDHYHQNQAAAKAAVPRQVAFDPYEVELREAVMSKAGQHLYEATIRIIAVADTKAEAQRRTQAVITSLQTFSSERQAIVARRPMPILDSPDMQLAHYRRRTLAARPIAQNMVLSGSEITSLYHFPNTRLTKTQGLVKSRSPELPAPLSLKAVDPKFDVVIGVNNYDGELSPIGLTLDQRQKHTYVIGKTGMGKTTMLKGMIYQDMVNGKGLAVLDPHGDMFHELLQMVPEHRLKDVVVFNPADRDFPVGLNLFDPGVDFASEDDKHEWITSTVLSVFAKLTDEAYWGPRMEHILSNATLTALQLPNPTLYTLQQLLTDRRFQVEAAKTLTDRVLQQFWQKEFALLGDMQLSTVTAPLTHRLGHFITTKRSRHILLQQTSTVRIADIMNEGKILLVNLSKGDLGEDQSAFFGIILTSLIWMAAYQRTKLLETQRRDFFVYVDEFQNFATPKFGSITSEGRKFRVSLIASHQNVAQIEDSNLLKIVAGNAATIICLKASPADEDFILPFMQPEVSKGDIVNLTRYQFFMKTSGETSEDAFSGQTTPVDAPKDKLVEEAVVAASRARYGTPLEEVVEYVDTLFGAPSKAQTPNNRGKGTTTKKDAKPDQTLPLTSRPDEAPAAAPKPPDEPKLDTA